jgi:hypothetical protein
LLNNGDFEEGSYHQDNIPEVAVPDGWRAFWYEGAAVHDDKNDVGYARPEMRVIERREPFLDPPRIFSGNWAASFFGTYKVIDAGYYQQVSGILPDQTLELTAWGHAWANNTTGNPRLSDAATEDDRRNATIWIGIDVTGRADPWSPIIEWSEPAHIYDAYAQIGPVRARAVGDTATVFIRGRTLWPFRNSDFYFDAVRLEYVR